MLPAPTSTSLPYRPGVTTDSRHRAGLELVWGGIALDLLYAAEEKLVRLEPDCVVAVASGAARKRRGHLARHSSLSKDTRERSVGMVAVSRWMRWHHVIGLFASVIVLVWMFSGWLSMDHGRLFFQGVVAADRASRFQGMRLDAVARAIPRGFMGHVESATEVTFGAVAGQAFISAQGGLSNPPGSTGSIARTSHPPPLSRRR